MSAGWSDLRTELDALADRGMRARFWLRDDDAVGGTAALLRLADWAENNETEILLALIPSPADETLRAALAAQPKFIAAVHGWAHRNHAPPDEKKQELGPHRTLAAMRSELGKAKDRTAALCGGRSPSILVPPWNRIAPALLRELPRLGYDGLSTFSDSFASSDVAGLRIENAHLDIIDWRGSRRGRAHGALLEELIGLIRRRASAGEPIGVLSHHPAHDETAWSFLERLGSVVNEHPAADWRSPDEVFGARETRPPA